MNILMTTIYGPKNKILRDEFLKTLVDYLNLDTSLKQDDIEKESYSSYYWLSEHRINCYKNFLENNPKLIYNEEEFYITNIVITTTPLGDFEEKKTYKYLWEMHDKYMKPIPKGRCPCEDLEDELSSDEENKKVNIKILSIDSFKNISKNINYKGKYFSEPYSHSMLSGGQFLWEFGFNYTQDDISIFVSLGTKNIIDYKRYDSNKLIVNQYHKKLVYSYKPSNLFFDDDFYDILKNALVENKFIIEYKCVTYELMDYKFCEVDGIDFSCGHFYNSCKNKTKEWWLSIMSKNKGYMSKFRYSCTPEWYLQLQIGMCNDSGYCGRFILKPFKTHM